MFGVPFRFLPVKPQNFLAMCSQNATVFARVCYPEGSGPTPPKLYIEPNGGLDLVKHWMAKGAVLGVAIASSISAVPFGAFASSTPTAG